MFDGLVAQRLVALFMAGLVLLNFPLLALWDRDATLAGLPFFPVALFLIWGGLIASLAYVLESGQAGSPESDE
jgi:hypothetical protein